MLTASQDAVTVTRCLARGAVGYLHKSQPPERLPQSLRDAAEGRSPMTPDIARLVREFFQSLAPANHEWAKLSSREKEVLELLVRGFVKKEIADQLGISEETVRTHCSHIYDKLHVNCREHAVAKAIPLTTLGWMKQKGSSKTRHIKAPLK
jgi:DNA-binding NarL/FixJ family response regulator